MDKKYRELSHVDKVDYDEVKALISNHPNLLFHDLYELSDLSGYGLAKALINLDEDNVILENRGEYPTWSIRK